MASFLSQDERQRILDLRAAGHTYEAIAYWVGRDASNIRRICNQRTTAIKRRILTDDERAAIIQFRREYPGMSQSEIAAHVGVHQTTVGDVLRGKK